MKKISRRLISVLLAALLITTSMPLFAFTAFAAGIDDLNAAISAYEAKMDGTVYTNMKTAYDEYIDALAAKDAYVYGGDTAVDVAAAASALNTATNAMTAWTPATFTATAYYCDDEATDGYSNVVYQQSGNTVFSAEKQIESVKPKIAVPGNIVLAYDGVNETSAPIVLETLANRGRSQIWKYAAVNNGNFSLKSNWYGYQSGNYQTWPKDNYDGAMQQIGYDSSHEYNASGQTNTSTARFWWNKLVYTGTGDTTRYYETVTSFSANIKCYHARYLMSSAGDFTGTTNTASVDFYVINYKPVVDGYNTMSAALTAAFSGTNTVENYAEGGLASLLTAFAKITDDTTIDPNNYSYSDTASDVATVASKIKTATSDLNFTTPTTDGNGYGNLRTAITRTKATYDATNDSGAYTADSWAAFADAYEAAQNIMKAQPTDEYNNDSGAATAAQTLNDAFDALQTVASKVDTTPITSLVTAFRSWDTIFTDETYAAVEAAIEAASQAVWNGNYGVAADALDDSPEAQATVETHRAAIANAIKGLRISPNAVAISDNMRMSMNQALALDVSEPSDYANYTNLTNAKTTAQAYMATAATTDFTDYDTQYAEYVSYVQAIYDAYNGLLPSFLKIPDGDAAQNTNQTNMSQLTTSDQGKQIVQFGYTNGAVIMKMNHDATTAQFGIADILFATNIEGKVNNMLDSITINATANPISGNDAKNHIRDLSTWTSTPYALSNSEKATYAACLEYNGFSITDIRYLGAANNSPEQFATDNSGNVISSTDAYTTDFTPILGTLDGAATNPGTGGIFARSIGSTATVLLEGKFNLAIPGSTAAGVESNSHNEITSATYAMNDTYFGAVTLYNCQNISNCAGYDWYTSKTNNETINISVVVVDAANLVDLILAADAILDTEDLYTVSSWNEFTAALTAAQQDIDYNTLSADAIVTELQTRYDNLWREWKDAADGLQFAANNQSLKDARLYSMTDKVKTVDQMYADGNAGNVWSAGTWSDFVAAYETVTGTNGLGNKYSDLNIRNYGTSEQPTIDGLAQALKDAYDALEEAGALVEPAVTAYSNFVSALADYTYTAASLKAAHNYIKDLGTTYGETYIDDPAYDAAKTKVDATTENIHRIAAEKAAFENALAALDASEEFHQDEFNIYVANAQRSVNDPDAYDANKLLADVETLEHGAFETVTVGTTDVIGLKENAWIIVEAANTAVIEDCNTRMQYTVVVKDADGNDITASANITPAPTNGKFDYGTAVTVSAGEGDYTYDYVSNTSNTGDNKIHRTKNIGTVDSFTFTVQGDTTITVGAATANKPIKVTYKAVLAPVADGEASNTFTIGTEYVASAQDVDVNAYKAPTYAFYKLDSRTKGDVANNEMTVTLNYVLAGSSPMFTVYNASNGDEINYYLNELVTVQIDAAQAIASAADQDSADGFYDIEDYEAAGQFLTLLAYGDTYTFRAKEDLYLVDLWMQGDEVCLYTQNDENGDPSQVYVKTTDPQVVNTSDIVTYNTVALPEGYTLVEAGILVQYNKTAGAELLDRELNFTNVGEDIGNDKIRRLKASKIYKDEDNRYTINLHLNCSNAKVKYIAYVNYTDGEDDTVHTVFTDAQYVTVG